MYKNLLVPTDGSRLSMKAVTTAMKLARPLGAKVTALHVVPPYAPPVYADAMVYVPELDPREYKAATEGAARKALAAVEKEAARVGVACTSVHLVEAQPWEGILKAAKKHKCDAIVMASHGRRGLAGVLLGSETVKVLTHSKIPVLVCR